MMLSAQQTLRRAWQACQWIFSRPSIQASVTAILALEIIFFHDLWAEHRYQFAGLAVAGLLGLVLIRRYWKSPQQRSLALLVLTHSIWLAALALFVPATSPFLVLNLVLVFLTWLLVPGAALALSIGSLLIGIQLAWLRDIEELQFADYLHVIVHMLYVVVFGLLLGRVGERIIGQSPPADELGGERLRQLINSMADGVVAIDEKGRVMVYNGAALDILDVNASLEGQSLDQYLHLINEKNRRVRIIKLAAQHDQRHVTRDLRLRYNEHEAINLYLSIAPVRVSYGETGQKGYIIIMRDITREKSLEEERDEFISVVSHELRTPVTVAEGSISNAQLMLQRDLGKEKMAAMLKTAHEEVIFLAELINDLSTLSRAERGTLQVEPEPIDATALAEELVTHYRPDAQRKNLTLKAEPDPNVPPFINSRLYVREILQNFITNAIKYTEAGGVTVKVAAADDGVTFIVSDTGIGISIGDQKRIFEKFFRSEDFRTRQNSGTGLGLYVTSKLAEMTQATIKVESNLDKGSTFYVSVPSLDERLRGKTRRVDHSTKR